MPELARTFSEAERRFAGTVRHVCVSDARVQPFSGSESHRFVGGPVLEAEAHQLFRHHRDGAIHDEFLPERPAEEHFSGDYVYAGLVYTHFGHFMAEMAHRIVPAQVLGLPGRFLFVAARGSAGGGFASLPAYIRDVLSFCGLGPDDVAVVTRDATVERLHLVQQAGSLGGYPRPGYVEALGPYAARSLDRLHGDVSRPARLYVSRSVLSRKGSFLGESYIEDRFARAGFTIFRPEAHGVTAQMDHYRKAACIVFPGGSACHGAELLGVGMLKKVVFLPRWGAQDFMLSRVLRPRALACLDPGVAVYAGSISLNEKGEPYDHIGVTLFDLAKFDAIDRFAGTAIAKTLSPVRYGAAVARDLVAYLREPAAGIETRSLAAARPLVGRVLRVLRGRSGEPVPREAPPGPRLLSDREIAAIWNAAGALDAPLPAFLRVLILTLQQPPHLVGIRFSELSPDGAVWTIPSERLKHGKAPHPVPLSEPVRAILAGRPAESERVFPMPGNPARAYGAAKQALDETLGLPPWSLSDIRATGLARLDERGYDRAALRRLAALSGSGAAPSWYASEWRQALDDWAGLVAAALGTRDAESAS